LRRILAAGGNPPFRQDRYSMISRLAKSSESPHIQPVMAILKIARLGHPVLLQRAAPVEDPAAPEIRRLIADMVETLEDAGGVGLAAPQVHVPLRLFIYFVPERRSSGLPDDEARPLSAVINPEIAVTSPETVLDWEGCLSIPGLTAAVPRASRIIVQASDETGARFTRPASGFQARVIQHEADHLDGILYLSRMRDHRLIGYNEEITRFRPQLAEQGPAQEEDR
jgi:peptide deformylase